MANSIKVSKLKSQFSEGLIDTHTKVTSNEISLTPIFDGDSPVEAITYTFTQIHSNQLIYTWLFMTILFNRMASVSLQSIVVVRRLALYLANLLIVQMLMRLVHFVQRIKMLVPTITHIIMNMILHWSWKQCADVKIFASGVMRLQSARPIRVQSILCLLIQV